MQSSVLDACYPVWARERGRLQSNRVAGMRYLVILEQRRLPVLCQWSEELKCHQWSCYVGITGEHTCRRRPQCLDGQSWFPSDEVLTPEAS